MSFIQSLFGSFGAGFVAGDTGVTLQNRGAGFTLRAGHPNQVGPHKRPLHTLVPAMIMKDGKPWVSFGVMGGDNQAQAHAQMVANFVDFGMHVQEAGDAARMRHLGDSLALESGIGAEVRQALEAKGHVVVDGRGADGRLSGHLHRSEDGRPAWRVRPSQGRTRYWLLRITRTCAERYRCLRQMRDAGAQRGVVWPLLFPVAESLRRKSRPSRPPRTSRRPPKPSPKAQQQGGDTAKGMADMAKAMQGMAAAVGGGDGKPVDPVSTDTLKATLPQIAGWDAGEPSAERMTSPIAFSQVETEYKNGNAEIDVKVVDTGYAQMLIAPWAMFLASGYSRETNEGYEKATTIAGHPGFETLGEGRQARRAERLRRQALPRHHRRR